MCLWLHSFAAHKSKLGVCVSLAYRDSLLMTTIMLNSTACDNSITYYMEMVMKTGKV